MGVHKVIEILANSNKSWEDAAQQALNEAAKTVHNIESVYIQDFMVKCSDNKVTEYRVNAKITFRVD